MKRNHLLVSLLWMWCGAAAAQEETHINKNSREFVNAFHQSVERLDKSGFGDELQSASLGAVSGPEAEALLKKINREDKIDGVSLGNPDTEYDIILQPGHYLRKSGMTGAQGKSVSERALVAHVVGNIYRDLKKHSLNVLVVSADQYHPHLKAKVFLAVHADGNVRSCATGPSLGYEKNTSMHAMHAIGWGLSQALGYTYADFMKDNLTVGESKYYMFSKVKTSSVKGILEIGEVTCEAQQDRLIINADKIAANVARALRFVVGTP